MPCIGDGMKEPAHGIDRLAVGNWRQLFGSRSLTPFPPFSLPVELIVTELVWPALNIKEGYEAATVTLKDGTVVTGFKQTEKAEVIAIRDLATGAVRSIPRSEAKEVTMGGTVMPDGLTAGMDERQLAHLVRNLMGLGE